MPIQPQTIDEYLQRFPLEVRQTLQRIRETIQKAAPEAHEAIKYRMPTFVLQGNLVHFAAHTKHIGFYPTPSAIVRFQSELAGYRQAKGSVQFPLDEPIPLDLIGRIVQFRVEESLAQTSTQSGRGKPDSTKPSRAKRVQTVLPQDEKKQLRG